MDQEDPIQPHKNKQNQEDISKYHPDIPQQTRITEQDDQIQYEDQINGGKHLKQQIQVDFNSPIIINPRIINEEKNYEAQMVQLNSTSNPFEFCLDYLYWTETNYGIDSKQYRNLLERMLQFFNTNNPELQDIRLLRLWIKYSKTCMDREEVMLSLERRKYGQQSNLFYMEMQQLYEAMGNYQKANHYLLSGINQKVEPISELKEELQKFEKRMIERIENEFYSQEMYLPSGSKRNLQFNIGTKQQDQSSQINQSSHQKKQQQPSQQQKIWKKTNHRRERKPYEVILPDIYQEGSFEIYVDQENRQFFFPKSTYIVQDYETLLAQYKTSQYKDNNSSQYQKGLNLLPFSFLKNRINSTNNNNQQQQKGDIISQQVQTNYKQNNINDQNNCINKKGVINNTQRIILKEQTPDKQNKSQSLILADSDTSKPNYQQKPYTFLNQSYQQSSLEIKNNSEISILSANNNNENHNNNSKNINKNNNNNNNKDINNTIKVSDFQPFIFSPSQNQCRTNNEIENEKENENNSSGKKIYNIDSALQIQNDSDILDRAIIHSTYDIQDLSNEYANNISGFLFRKKKQPQQDHQKKNSDQKAKVIKAFYKPEKAFIPQKPSEDDFRHIYCLRNQEDDLDNDDHDENNSYYQHSNMNRSEKENSLTEENNFNISSSSSNQYNNNNLDQNYPDIYTNKVIEELRCCTLINNQSEINSYDESFHDEIAALGFIDNQNNTNNNYYYKQNNNSDKQNQDNNINIFQALKLAPQQQRVEDQKLIKYLNRVNFQRNEDNYNKTDMNNILKELYEEPDLIEKENFPLQQARLEEDDQMMIMIKPKQRKALQEIQIQNLQLSNKNNQDQQMYEFDFEDDKLLVIENHDGGEDQEYSNHNNSMGIKNSNHHIFLQSPNSGQQLQQQLHNENNNNNNNQMQCENEQKQDLIKLLTPITEESNQTSNKKRQSY